ncbi:hypothetical protein BH10BAC5_BH10BAC5_04880 [soil metagenome]
MTKIKLSVRSVSPKNFVTSNTLFYAFTQTWIYKLNYVTDLKVKWIISNAGISINRITK